MARVVFLLLVGCANANANADADADVNADAHVDAISTDATTEPDGGPCSFHSKLGPHLLGDPNDPAAQTLLAACPRVAKWVGADPASLSAFRTRCPQSAIVLRIYVPSTVHYAATDDAALSANDFWVRIQPDLPPPALIDWLEGPNELDNLPDWYHDMTAAEWFARFWDALADQMNAAGYHPLAGSIAMGNPALDGEMNPLAGVLRSKPYLVGWSYHAYADDLTQLDPWTLLRYRMLGMSGIPLVLTEGGQDGDRGGWRSSQRSTAPTEYLDFLARFDRELARDDDVVGVTLFQVGDRTSWADYDLSPIASDLAAHITQPQACATAGRP